MTSPQEQKSRAQRGRRAHASGLAAEDAAARLYAGMGGQIAGRRVRTPHGEIDLVVHFPGLVVFVEVKSRKNPALGSKGTKPDGSI